MAYRQRHPYIAQTFYLLKFWAEEKLTSCKSRICGLLNKNRKELDQMKKYIGTKIVEAEPAYRSGGKVYPITGPYPKSMDLEEGYKVRYADGYESWSPKDVFERAYLPITVNENLKTDAPSISKQMVDDFVAFQEVTTVGCKTTIVRVVLRNGFEIVESSSCVSAANYDEKLGAEICMKKIKDKIWMLLGFLLQTGVEGVKI